MKTKNLVALAAICLFLVSLLAVPGHAIQPPVDTSTYWVGTIGQPRRVDPARAYDTASAELIQNVYETLVYFSDKPRPDYSYMSINVTDVGYADLSHFEGVLAETWWFETRGDGGVSLCFKIKTGIPFQPWYAANGSLICEYMDIYDVEYSFKRMLVHDMIGAPSWMIALPFTGHMFPGWDIDEDEDTMNTIEPVGVDGRGERLMRDLINNAITVYNETVIKFNMLPGKTWPEVALLQIFAESWGSIVSKDFCIEHGCWDGSFADGWSTLYRCMPSYLYTPLDRYYSAKSKYTAGDHDVPAMCGTGPYMSRKVGSTYGNKVDWDTATLTWYARAWENFPGVPADFQTYRGGWVTPGIGPHSIRTIKVQGIPEWPTRKMMFLKGDFDSVAVPRANMWDLLKEGQQYEPLEGIRLYYDAPALSNDAMFYCLTVDPTSPYVPKVGTGATAVPKPDLFSDVHMRRAFNYALNFTTYLRDAWWGEAWQQASWWVDGLQPPEAKNTTLVPYNYDPAMMAAELQQAWGGEVWNKGFEIPILYNLGNDQRKIAAEMIRDAFLTLGSKFKVVVVGVDWPVILDYMELFYMPIYFIGWLADFAHPDNFARPFMHSHGDFSFYQNYSDPYVDNLIDTAIITTDIPTQCAMYQELQYIYWRDAVSLPIMQGLGRRWEREWVRGWYYNQLYPGLLFYDLWKTVEAPPTEVDVSVTNIELSPVANITEWLISQTSPGKPWMKLHPVGATAPKANVKVYVTRYDTGVVPVLVYVIWYANTSKGHVEEFGFDYWYQAGGTTEDYGPRNVSNAMPAVGLYEFYVEPFVLGNVKNINLTAAFDGGYFKALGYCDVNDDNVVDVSDVQKTKAASGTMPGQPKWNYWCDVNVDGVVDVTDYQKVKSKTPTSYSEA